MKRILFVLDSLRQGGAEKELVTLLNALPAEGLALELCLANAGGVYMAQIPSRIPVREPKVTPPRVLKRAFMGATLRLNRMLNKPFHPAQISWRFLRANHAEATGDYDVAVAYSQGFPTYFVASRVRALKKIAWVNTDYKKAGYRAGLDSKYYTKFHNIVCVSNTTMETFRLQHSQLSEKLVMVRSFVDANEVRSLGGDENPFSDSDRFQITTVCRLSAPKGLDILLDASQRLASSGLRFHWHVVGDGDLRPWLEALIRDKGLTDFVILHGARSNPFPYMKFCDVYCQPSRFEGFPRTVAEARAFAKPVVVTDFQSARDQIVDGQNGLVVGMNGAEVAGAIAHLAADPTLLDRLSANSRQIPSDTMSGVATVLEMFGC